MAIPSFEGRFFSPIPKCRYLLQVKSFFGGTSTWLCSPISQTSFVGIFPNSSNQILVDFKRTPCSPTSLASPALPPLLPPVLFQYQTGPLEHAPCYTVWQSHRLAPHLLEIRQLLEGRHHGRTHPSHDAPSLHWWQRRCSPQQFPQVIVWFGQ